MSIMPESAAGLEARTLADMSIARKIMSGHSQGSTTRIFDNKISESCECSLPSLILEAQVIDRARYSSLIS